MIIRLTFVLHSQICDPVACGEAQYIRSEAVQKEMQNIVTIINLKLTCNHEFQFETVSDTRNTRSEKGIMLACGEGQRRG